MDNTRVKIAVTITGVILIITGLTFYMYKNPGYTNRGFQEKNRNLTAKDEAVLQKELGKIITDNNLSGCASITNEIYKTVCRQILSPESDQNIGTQLQTSTPEPMTDAQLREFLEKTPPQPQYEISVATTT